VGGFHFVSLPWVWSTAIMLGVTSFPKGSFHHLGDGEDGAVREDLWELCGWPQNSGLWLILDR